MNLLHVIQHTSSDYLGLMEDHLEGRRIRFQYYRPFAAGKLPATDLPADALILLGGGPWGAAGSRDLPTLEREVELARPRLGEGPVIKVNANQRYATDAESSARFTQWCERADVKPQHFVTRSDLRCGSPIQMTLEGLTLDSQIFRFALHRSL